MNQDGARGQRVALRVLDGWALDDDVGDGRLVDRADGAVGVVGDGAEFVPRAQVRRDALPAATTRVIDLDDAIEHR